MARIIDRDTVEYSDGEILHIDRELRRSLRLVGRFCAGRVMEAGLGFGIARRSLWRSRFIRRLKTIESRLEAIETWRARKADEATPYEDSPENALNEVEENTIEQAVATEANRAVKRYDALFYDLGREIITDSAFHADINRMFPALGGRLVVFWARYPEPPRIPGWISTQVILEEGVQPIWTLDRWDPDAGIGDPPGKGKIRVPGAGWVPLSQIGG